MDRTKSLVAGAIIAVIGTAVGASSVLGATMVAIRIQGVERTSTRIESALSRDADLELRVQDRRTARIREEMAAEEVEVVHAAASEERLTLDRRAYFRAYRYCEDRKFTRARFADCIDSMLQDGVYEGDYYVR